MPRKVPPHPSKRKRAPPKPRPAAPTTLIFAERLKREWTQQDLADRVTQIAGREITANTISRWESDKRGISLQELGWCAEALGLSARELVPGKPGEAAAEVLTEEERAWLAVFRNALPHERATMSGVWRSLHENRSTAFETRPASGKR
jgi:transcriptional regulator with XRE-family HTH domain